MSQPVRLTGVLRMTAAVIPPDPQGTGGSTVYLFRGRSQRMRKVLVIAALAALAILLDSGMASARGRKCGGGRHHRGGCGGGGCSVGGCGGGYGHGGCGGGYAYGGGGTCGGYAYAAARFHGGYALLAAGTTATGVVELPADATATIDGATTTS